MHNLLNSHRCLDTCLNSCLLARTKNVTAVLDQSMASKSSQRSTIKIKNSTFAKISKSGVSRVSLDQRKQDLKEIRARVEQKKAEIAAEKEEKEQREKVWQERESRLDAARVWAAARQREREEERKRHKDEKERERDERRTRNEGEGEWGPVPPKGRPPAHLLVGSWLNDHAGNLEGEITLRDLEDL